MPEKPAVIEKAQKMRETVNRKARSVNKIAITLYHEIATTPKDPNQLGYMRRIHADLRKGIAELETELGNANIVAPGDLRILRDIVGRLEDPLAEGNLDKIKNVAGLFTPGIISPTNNMESRVKKKRGQSGGF